MRGWKWSAAWLISRAAGLGAILLLLLLALTAVTDYYILWRVGRGYSVTVEKAGVIAEYTPWPVDLPSVLHVGIVHGSNGWWFGFDHTRGHIGVLLPLWALLLATVAIGAPLWLSELRRGRARRRLRAGLCPGCGYDRGGLSSSTPCPECGVGATASA